MGKRNESEREAYMYAGELFLQIRNNMSYSILLVVITLILGYAFSSAAARCDAFYQIGKSLDIVTGWFATVSVCFYATSTVLFLVLIYICLSEDVIPVMTEASLELDRVAEQMADEAFNLSEADSLSIKKDINALGLKVSMDDKNFIGMAKETVNKVDSYMGIITEEYGDVIWE